MALSVDLLELVLNRLAIDVIYRLYRTSSLVRKATTNKPFWRRLIERDLGVVPKFAIDYKLHYLRAMELPLSATVLDFRGKVIRRNVLKLFGGDSMLLKDKTIQVGGLTIHPPKGDKFRQLVGWDNIKNTRLLTNSGKIFNLMGRVEDTDTPLGTVKMVSSRAGLYLLTREGRVYRSQFGEYTDFSKIELPEKIIQVVLMTTANYLNINDTLTAISETGKMYHFRGDGQVSPRRSESRYQWTMGSYSILDDGSLEGATTKLAAKHLPIVAGFGAATEQRQGDGVITKNLELIPFSTTRIGTDVVKTRQIYSKYPNIIEFSEGNQFRVLE